MAITSAGNAAANADNELSHPLLSNCLLSQVRREVVTRLAAENPLRVGRRMMRGCFLHPRNIGRLAANKMPASAPNHPTIQRIMPNFMIRSPGLSGSS